MTENDWRYIKTMARDKGVTLRDAGVNKVMTLGRAMDCVLAAAERAGGKR